MTLADGTLGRNEGEVYPANALLLKDQRHSQLIQSPAHFWRTPGDGPVSSEKVTQFSIDSKGFSRRLPATRLWRFCFRYPESPSGHRLATSVKPWYDPAVSCSCRRRRGGAPCLARCRLRRCPLNGRRAAARATLGTAAAGPVVCPRHGQPAGAPWRVRPRGPGGQVRQGAPIVTPHTRGGVAGSGTLGGVWNSRTLASRRRLASTRAGAHSAAPASWARPGAASAPIRTPCLAAGRALNRREGGGDTRRPARPPLAGVAPAWLRTGVTPPGRTAMRAPRRPLTRQLAARPGAPTARHREAGAAFQAAESRRAGIDGTIARPPASTSTPPPLQPAWHAPRPAGRRWGCLGSGAALLPGDLACDDPAHAGRAAEGHCRRCVPSGAFASRIKSDQDPGEEYRWKVLTPLIESSRGESEASSVPRIPIELHGNIGVFSPFALLYTHQAFMETYRGHRLATKYNHESYAAWAPMLASTPCEHWL